MTGTTTTHHDHTPRPPRRRPTLAVREALGLCRGVAAPPRATTAKTPSTASAATAPPRCACSTGPCSARRGLIDEAAVQAALRTDHAFYQPPQALESTLACEVWLRTLLDGADHEQAAEPLCKQYGVDSEQAQADISALVKALTTAKLARRVSTPFTLEEQRALRLRRRLAAELAVAAARLLATRPPRRIRAGLHLIRCGARPATAAQAQAQAAPDAVVAFSTRCAGQHCLQRSLATALLCRTGGTRPTWRPAVRTAPFRAHAWVEADGQPVGEPHPAGCHVPTLTVGPAER